jgi:hypothetical protein
MEQQELYLMLGRIDSKLDALASQLIAHVSDDKEVEQRVTKLENKVTYWGGGLGLIVLVLTTFGSDLLSWFKQ